MLCREFSFGSAHNIAGIAAFSAIYICVKRKSSMGYYDALEGDAERTAFRKAEKRYKLYKNSSSIRHSKSRDKVPATDLSDVLDFKMILDSFNQNGSTSHGIVKLEQQFDWPVFAIADRPGFYFIPGALSMDEQFFWIKESLRSFPQPPNRTNHNAIHGAIPDLWLAVQKNKTLVELQNTDSAIESDLCPNPIRESPNGSNWTFMDESELKKENLRGALSFKSIAASVLLRKLRWATLGLQFDWSKRNYDVSLPHKKIPDELSQLAKDLAKPAMQEGEFCAEAAIVNYFGPDDMLGGHVDDMEADWSKPIVSISLGCKAVFLLGGTSRQDPPIAMFLRSGDVLLMAGPARQCFHGIPRIFTEPESSEVPFFQGQFSGPSDASFVDYLRESRININIRQVY